ncbi:hypothetical protein GGR28_001748 [Lewinella aquimaris]|uniref:Caspase domain-containing protein n=1 Tax=Neolewinella aquimaris TaxID=1835722 RepID=A0A840E1N8_9BACT|nr:caspase family protein [Neolewinella aquimaris]MBB4079131.1 hypothetical protein [Neolewinella aquimaris]
MATLTALLVGIDRYPAESGVSPLRGCGNDIDHWKDLLLTYFGGDAARIRVLKDESASYSNIVAALANTADEVGPGDRFCFVYAGHGSREPAAGEFARYFPEALQETLVCYDSRLPGGHDLADKELLYLIRDIADRGAEVTVVLDCCHSGSGTRSVTGNGTLIRRAPDRRTPRPLASYLGGKLIAEMGKAGEEYRLPAPRHLLLAACRRNEEARELPNRRGLLSGLVEQAVRETDGRITHADLYRRITVGALNVTASQHPQLETYGGFDGSGGFLGSEATVALAELPAGRAETGEYYVSIGARDGLPDQEPERISFRLSASGKTPVIVRARSVGFDRTVIEKFPGGDEGVAYTARLQSPPRPAAPVHLKVGADWETQLLEGGAGRPSPYYHLSPSGTRAAYSVVEGGGGLRIVRQADDRTLYTVSGAPAEGVVRALLNRLETVMRWEYLVALDATAPIADRDAVELILEVRERGHWVVPPVMNNETVVAIPHTDGRTDFLQFRVSVRNRHPDKPLYCALFFPTDRYHYYFTGFNARVDAGTTVVAWDEVADGSPTRFAASGTPTSLHLLKLFVSERELDVSGMNSPGFTIGETERVSSNKRSVVPGIDPMDSAPAGADWWAQLLRIRVDEQQPAIGAEPLVLLDGQVTVRQRRDTFRAEVAVSSLGQGKRSLSENSRLRELLDGQRGTEVVQFSSGRRGSTNYAVLELRNIHNAGALADNPLELELDLAMEPDDGLQAVAFDGEYLLPIGELSTPASASRSILRIHHLPEPGAGDRRSLTGALKLVFLKYVLRQPGHRLRWVDYSGVTPRRTATDLKARVGKARRILLCIHGIIGDTEGMAAFGQAQVESGQYDLVLTFDYENLSTLLEDTSKTLGDALRQEAGMTPEHELTILAHSMGGLVARHFIECRRGGELVDRLIMAGTPNAGSEIARVTKYRDGAVILLGLAINFGWSFPAAAALSAALKASGKVTKTLEQMLPNSTYLDQLEDAPDPGVDYRVLAGNLDDYLSSRSDVRRLMDKLYRMGGQLFYRNLPNDVAVSIDSIRSVPVRRQPLAEAREVACHHLNYFTEPESTVILEEFLAPNEHALAPNKDI